ncbi:MAG: ATP-binding protein [Haloarculaceae archaeon]
MKITDDEADTDRFRLMFHAASVPALITDPEFRTLAVNDAFLSLGAWERDRVLDGTPAVLFEDHRVYEDATATLEAGGVWTDTFVARGENGWRKHVEGRATPLRDSGDLLGYGFVFEDRTEFRQQAEGFRVLNRVLRHNLRNDANVVLGHIEDVRERLDDAEAREALSTAATRIESILGRADTTREFARLLAEDGSDVLYPVRVDGAVRQAINPLDTDGATVSVATRDGEQFVLADETVTAAVRSLVENALEHAGESPTVEVTTCRRGDRVVVRVADDGPGIDPAVEDQVFARNETPVRHGQGLSLFFVERVMAVYGGTVEVDDSEAGGARVDLVFQRVDPSDHP